jgi:hypothetical protein
MGQSSDVSTKRGHQETASCSTRSAERTVKPCGEAALSVRTERALVYIALLAIATTLTVGSVRLLMSLEVLR